MKSLQDYMDEYRKQVEKGDIQEAYKGLMKYITELRLHFKNKYPDYFVSGVYPGYMDMTYFSFSPESLKQRNLKIAIVFLHDAFRFEAWLAGYNKQVQSKYWKLFKDNNWNKYHIPSKLKGVDSIMEYVLVENPDFSDLDALKKHIEAGILRFSKDVEGFLSEH